MTTPPDGSQAAGTTTTGQWAAEAIRMGSTPCRPASVEPVPMTKRSASAVAVVSSVRDCPVRSAAVTATPGTALSMRPTVSSSSLA